MDMKMFKIMAQPDNNKANVSSRSNSTITNDQKYYSMRQLIEYGPDFLKG